MKHIYKTIFAAAIMLASGVAAIHADDFQEDRYRRSSLCSILVKHQEQKFADSIANQFIQIRIPETYNDHNLSVQVVSVNSKGNYDAAINRFIKDNNIASRLVGKWFDRDVYTGACTMNLVKKRGVLDASVHDYQVAAAETRGFAEIQDAGEELIPNTYLLMNEVNYVDKAKRSSFWGGLAALAGGLAAAYTGNSSYQTLGNTVGAVVSSIKGFSVKIHSRLYKLVWDEETAGMFYNQHYTDEASLDAAKKSAFERDRSKYRLEYVGDIVSKGSRTSFLGIKEEEPHKMIRKATARAIDENIADLGKKYEQFRVKIPISTVDPTITAPIGLREGMTPQSKYEVLEKQQDDKGRVKYKRVGVVKPVASKIWDNRFMAKEEGAFGANFGCTTFVRVSGKKPEPGYLLREIVK